ncbi:MAG: TonB-dependent receptor plug domain-containing protein, partial [Bacteroidetes bacterium]|nr:TonB-dependent receptor plug domain-containing protein [Bacteroidota bacterium]
MQNFIRSVSILPMLFFAFGIVRAQSGQGILIGQVRTESGRALSGAKIFVLGTSDSGVTDADGKFSFPVSNGPHLAFIESPLHEIAEDSIFIEEGKDFFLNVVLNAITRMEGADIRVKAKSKENSVSQAIQTKRFSVQLVESVSAEDFAKTTIRTTSDAIKRIPGATISEGKFANIRGMFDRYNAGYLNGAPLPSTESDRKAFSFDVIPAALLDNIVVVKSATPDMIGDFGGGIIQINTKSVPEKFIQTASIGFQYNSITTFQTLDAFGLDGVEYLGMPSVKRTIPTLDVGMRFEPHTTSQNSALNARETMKFNNDWSLKHINVMPAPRFSYSLGLPFKLGKKEAGLLVSWNYAISPRRSEGNIVSKDYSTNYT